MNKCYKIFFFLLFTLSATLLFGQETKLNITTSPAGANLLIQGPGIRNLTVKTPHSINLFTGYTYTFTFTMTGYKTKTVTHTVNGTNLHVDLESDQPDQPTQQEVKLNVTSNPAGANVYIQGPGIRAFNFTTPHSLNLFAGYTYTFTFSKPGYKEQTVTHTVGNGNLNVTLAPDTFNLTVNSNIQGAYVYIDKQHVGNIPIKLQLAGGSYQVEVKQVGYKPFSTYVTMNGDQSVYANLEPDKYLNIKLPQYARLWVDGREQKINWGKRDTWLDIKVDASNGQKGANIKIQYYRLTVERYINFNRQTVSLELMLKGGDKDDDDDDD